MVLTITKGMTKKEIDELLKQLPVSDITIHSEKKPVDMALYSGKLKWKGNILETQRRMRDDSNYSY